MNLVEVGNRLRSVREEKGLSRERVAADNGISVSAITMYETGARSARDEIKEKLADYYGLSIGSLFYGEKCHGSWLKEVQQ